MRWWLSCGLLLSIGVLNAAEPKKAYLDEKDAGPDFAVQGEYAGEITVDGESRKVAAQVVARGDGKFFLAGYHGGLPGDGWNGDERIKLDGKTENGETKFQGPNFNISIKDGKLSVSDDGGTLLGTCPKVTRNSPTLGEKPPAGAIVLFDGTNADAWDPAVLADEMLMGVGTRTKQKFGSYRLHLEFRTPFMPSALGQARGNSGMYLHDQYECQILDSFGLDGADNECGGLYSVSKPQVNMCFPPLAWQTYDVELTAAKFDDQGKVVEPVKATIKHNGVVIHNNVSLKVTPGGGQNDQKPGALFLQNHGDPVRFRNIWLVETK
jgi:hypothetical protein